MHFFIAYFLGENSKFGIETSHTVRDHHWPTEKRYICFKTFMKENLANLIILPPKNGGLKAWSHSVRKANCSCLLKVSLLVRDQISSKCCVPAGTMNSITGTFVQTNPHGLAFLQLYKNCFTQLIIALVAGVHVTIHSAIFHQRHVTLITN